MPLLWLSLLFLTGILLGALLRWSISAWLLLAGAILVCWLVRFFLSRRASHLPSLPPTLIPPGFNLLLLLTLALGAARFQLSRTLLDASSLAGYNDLPAPVVLQGVVIEPPDERDASVHLRLRVDRLRPQSGSGDAIDWLAVDGRALVVAAPGSPWQYGDRIEATGALQTPYENEEFSYKEYLARQGMVATLSDPSPRLLERNAGSPILSMIYRLRENAVSTIYQIFPDPEASLLAGIVCGMDSGIPEKIYDAFRDTGTAHIIAISGFNITILAGLFSAIFLRLMGRRRRFQAAGLTIGTLAVYTILVGGSPAVARAAILGGLSVFGSTLGRRQHGLNSLALIAAVMAAFNPHILWDVGFQLSFMATLGLVLYADPLAQGFTGLAARRLPLPLAQKIAGPVGEYFLFTLAAQVTTLPVTVYHFQRLPLVSLLANPVILPAQPAVMILGGLAAILGMIAEPLGRLAAYLAWPWAGFTIRAVEWFASWRGGVLVLGKSSLFFVLFFYALLFGWTFRSALGFNIFLQQARALFSRQPPAAQGAQGAQPPAPLARFGMAAWTGGIGLFAVLAALFWRSAWVAPDGRLHLTLLDPGPTSAGDSLLIETPGGRFILIDGGASPTRLSDALGRRLPLDDRRLDWLVVASGESDQLSALVTTLERFPPDRVLWAGTSGASSSARTLRRNLTDQKVEIITAQAGNVLDLGQGARLEVLTAGKRGAVLRLQYGKFSALLPIGLDFDAQAMLSQDTHLTPVTALLLADGGFAPLNPPEWVRRWQPELILLSLGAGNLRGLPDAETLQTVTGYTLLRTDRNGWIELSTDGEQLWVQVERK